MLRSTSRDPVSFRTILYIVLGGHIISTMVFFVRMSISTHTVVIARKKTGAHALHMLPRTQKCVQHRECHESKSTLPQAAPRVEKALPKRSQPIAKTPMPKKKLPARNKKVQKIATLQSPKKITPPKDTVPTKKVETRPIVAHVEKSQPVAKSEVATVETAPIGSEQEAYAQRYEHVYRAIMQVWQPPRGVRTKKPAAIRVILDARGIVIQVELVESSGVVAFDVAARRASKSATYPRAVWNSTTVIHFT